MGSVAEPEIESMTAVLVGSFNPGIFQPAWLASKALIRESEFAAAEINVITEDVSNFTCDWFSLECISKT